MRFTNTYGELIDLSVVAPSIQASLIALIDADTVEFVRGNGFKYIAILSQSPILFLPFDGVTYVQGQYFDPTTYVFAKGVSNSLDVGSLAAGTYYIRIFEYNGQGGEEMYNRSVAEANPTSFTIEGDPGIFDFTFDETFE